MAILKLKPRKKIWIKYIDGLEDIQNQAVYIGMAMMKAELERGFKQLDEKYPGRKYEIKDIEFMLKFFMKKYKVLEANESN